jgi:Cd2+/Zn2+-exporting ATPase
LEAVTIDRASQKISLATLGQTDIPALTRKLSDTVERARREDEDHQCLLLEGEGNCSGCVHPVADVIRQRISIEHGPGTTTIARVTCPTAPKLWRWRDIPLPKVVPREVEFMDEGHDLDEWKGQMVAAILCGLFGLTAYLAHHQPWSLGAYLAAYLAGSWFTAQEVWEKLREKAIDVHFLMLAVAVGSASIGAWGEGAMLLFLFSFSGALEHYAMGRTQREIQSLFREAPKSATVIGQTGQESEMPVERLRPGLRLLIRPGAQFPVDAEVAKGSTAADESNLTGEATPVEKKVGDTVLAGTMNLWGAVEATVLRSASESSLQKIIHLIKEARHQKAPAQQFTDTFSTYYTYAALGLSLAMFFVWWLGFGLAPFTAAQGSQSAFYRTMTLLVVASPCALVLSIPSAVLAAIAWSARHGILFRGGAAVEKLADVTVVALDKTGTLTTGDLRVDRVESFPAGAEGQVAVIAYSLEKLSTHPLARAITRYGKQHQLEALEFASFESVSGQGLKATRGEQAFHLGRREWMTSLVPALTQLPPAALEAGCSEIWVSDGAVIGRFLLRDDLRPQARGVVEDLAREGLHTVVLTGDRKAAAEHLRAELKIEDIRAELNPEQKLGEIRTLTQNGNKVAMVGDGVNDAPSLAAAHIGIAMGARGSDAALEQADVVLMHDRLENVLAAFRLSQRARRIIRQNLVISLGTVVVLVVFALLGKIPLTLGVVGHEGSTVVVVMNSLRLLFTGTPARQNSNDQA